MSFSGNTASTTALAPSHASADAVLAREAGVPFEPPLGQPSGVDPFVEWLSLMEVVEMLCPLWPVRERPMQGSNWQL